MTLPSDLAVVRESAEILRSQRQDFNETGMASLVTRIDRLRRLEALVLANEATFIDAIDSDFCGRARQETILAEIVPVLGAIRHAAKHLSRWMHPERRKVGMAFQPGHAWVQHDPLGVVGIVSPWNYPLLLSLSPLAGVLAAGNRAMLKPSELTPSFAKCLARAVASLFDPVEIAVVIGDDKVARDFTRLAFDHLVFTGSTTIGREVMAAASQSLTPLTLELGGKSPALLTPDADMRKAADAVALAKFFNAGQTCLAPDYALVPASDVEAFGQAVIAASERLYPTLINNLDYTSIIADRFVERLDRWIVQAQSQGARVLRHRAPSSGRRYTPTVVLCEETNCALMQEEIFGPVLPVIGYDTIDDALRFIAERPAPLALYMFAASRDDERAILAATRSGGVTIGGAMLHCLQEDLPFGGLGASGFGAYHGEDGFRRFTHARAVYRPGRFNQSGRLHAPYGRLSAFLLHWLKGKPTKQAAAIADRMAGRSERA